MSMVHTESISDESGVDNRLIELVFEKSNRFSASWKFLRDNNRSLLEVMAGLDWIGAKIILFLNFPVAYSVSLMSAKYSPQNLGYKF